MILTYRYRVKDGKAAVRKELRRQASAVNFVWNYCCEIDREAQRRWSGDKRVKRPSQYDLIKLCFGCPQLLGIHSDTISAICGQFIASRNAIFPKTPRFRTAKRNLDWIPFTTFDRQARLNGDALRVLRKNYRVWLPRQIPEGAKKLNWEFSADSRGRWYVNIRVEIKEAAAKTEGATVGVDLGLKTIATLSDGTIVDAPQFYRKSERALALAQARGQKSRARTLAAKVANQRRHFLHVESTKLARNYATIVIGDVKPSALARTAMAKSVNDAGWAMFKTMLQYKAIAHGAKVIIANERYSTQTCSACGARSGPKGIAGLGIREWCCYECGAVHDRDHNAAKNIRLGAERRPPDEEIAA